jgi:hypothetical protein
MRLQPLLLPVRVLVLGAVLLPAAGCMSPAYNDPSRLGPFYTPINHVGSANLGGIHRVVVLPIWGGALAPVEMTAELDPVFAAALQRENRFEVVSFPREECLRRFHTEALSMTAALPHDLLPMLRREFAADAVLFIDLTAYSAYRPLAIGMRAKLAMLDDSRLVWSFDDAFSAQNPAVANSARHYYLEGRGSVVPADLTPAVLQSPGRFAAYAASAMFATLPPVDTPVFSKNPGDAAVNR